MSTITPLPPREDVVYPESDGKPIADNTLQFEWITTIKGGLDALFRDDPNVFVAGDLLWYPVEGNPKVRAAPDAMVVFGRPKGYRGSYIQHREGGIPPQVVFEVQSPGNTTEELFLKLQFYQRHGVEEYYLYDPDAGALFGWLRQGTDLRPIVDMEGWVSPCLQVRFGLAGVDLRLTGPDGVPFASYVELARQRDSARDRAENAWALAEQERARAEQERVRAEQEQARAEQERARAERLAARLAELGLDPEQF